MIGIAGADVIPGLAAGFAVAVFFLLVVLLLRAERARGEAAMQMLRVGELADRLALAQAELAGRLDHGQTSVGERLDHLSTRLGDGLIRQTERTQEQLRQLHERLAVVDQAQSSLGELTRQVGSLAGLLGNKQARGAFGEIQMQDLIRAVLPPAAFAFQVTLGNGCRVDGLLKLPEPPGPIAIDAKFPLESYRALDAADSDAARQAARRALADDLLRHVRDIASKYILPGETADSAMLFLPSEAVYAELHAHLPGVVAESFRRKVWIVSPTTLWATLNTLRAVLRDVRLSQEAQTLQQALSALLGEVDRLAGRVAGLERHFRQAEEDVRLIGAGCARVTALAARVDLDRIAPAAADADAGTGGDSGEDAGGEGGPGARR